MSDFSFSTLTFSVLNSNSLNADQLRIPEVWIILKRGSKPVPFQLYRYMVLDETMGIAVCPFGGTRGHKPFPNYNKFVADDFRIVKAKMWNITTFKYNY